MIMKKISTRLYRMVNQPKLRRYHWNINTLMRLMWKLKRNNLRYFFHGLRIIHSHQGVLLCANLVVKATLIWIFVIYRRVVWWMVFVEVVFLFCWTMWSTNNMTVVGKIWPRDQLAPVLAVVPNWQCMVNINMVASIVYIMPYIC